MTGRRTVYKWAPAYAFGALLVVSLALSIGGETLRQKAEPPGAAPEQAPGWVNVTLGLSQGTLVTLNVDTTPGMTVDVVVPIEGALYPLTLRPHSVRSDKYQLLVEVAPGVLEPAVPGPVRTLRGEVVGVPASVVLGSMRVDGLYASIRLPDGSRYQVEPAASRVPEALPGDYIVYRNEDVGGTEVMCAVAQPAGPPGSSEHSNTSPPGGGDGPTGLHVVELGIDADYEFYEAYGTVMLVEARIDAVMLRVNEEFEDYVGITHLITTRIVRTAEPDPYTTNVPSALLDEFRSEWENNQKGISRDLAHLFTGKVRPNGSGIGGVGYVGGVCTSFAYSLVSNAFPAPELDKAAQFSAHELGHNWGADHQCELGYTMFAGFPPGPAFLQFHPDNTVPEITAYRDSQSCFPHPLP